MGSRTPFCQLSEVVAGPKEPTRGLAFGARSHPHRHQDVKGAPIGDVANDRRRTGIRHHELYPLTADLLGDVEEVSGVEADLQWTGEITHLDPLLGGPVFGACC